MSEQQKRPTRLWPQLSESPRKGRSSREEETHEIHEKIGTAAIGKPGTSEITKTGDWRVFYPELDMEQCTRCGKCLENCPDAAIIERTLSGHEADAARKKAEELEKAARLRRPLSRRPHPI